MNHNQRQTTFNYRELEIKNEEDGKRLGQQFRAAEEKGGSLRQQRETRDERNGEACVTLQGERRWVRHRGKDRRRPRFTR